MWKVVTSSNLNPPLKLFFYLSILANNNLLLKIYCENIVVAFLNCIFPFFLSIIHTFPFLFLFFFLFLFSWFFSTTHVYPLYPSSLFLFLHFLLHSRTFLPLSFSSTLSGAVGALFLFFFSSLATLRLLLSLTHKDRPLVLLPPPHILLPTEAQMGQLCFFFF